MREAYIINGVAISATSYNQAVISYDRMADRGAVPPRNTPPRREATDKIYRTQNCGGMLP